MGPNKRARFCATVLYPFEKGASFDFETYCLKLAPRFAEILGTNCVKYEVRRGQNSPGATHPQFLCIANYWIASPEKFGEAQADPRFGPLMQEISRITTIQPIRQFDEVVLEKIGEPSSPNSE